MELVVGRGDPEHYVIHNDVFDYRTENGELDILMGGMVVQTYAAGKWNYVERRKRADEEWPNDEDHSNGEKSPGDDDFTIDLGQ